jgi:hypothetical protein
MFTRAEEKEKSDSGQVCEGGVHWGERIRQGMGNDREWDGFDATSWGIRPGITFQLLLEAILEMALWRVPWICGPHAGHRLANRAKGCFHGTRSGRLPTGCNFA